MDERACRNCGLMTLNGFCTRRNGKCEATELACGDWYPRNYMEARKEIYRVKAEATAMRVALIKIEWAGIGRSQPYCLCCRYMKHEGHEPGCEIGLILASNAGCAVTVELMSLRKVASGAKELVDAIAQQSGGPVSMYVKAKRVAVKVALDKWKGGAK